MDFEHIVTVTYEPPFWVVLFESYDCGFYSVARKIIGTSEPKWSELLLFFEHLDYASILYSEPILEEIRSKKSNLGFKKRQRKIKKKLEREYVYKHTYSKSHTVLKRQMEENKKECKLKQKKDKELRLMRIFELKQEKRKQKHRGH